MGRSYNASNVRSGGNRQYQLFSGKSAGFRKSLGTRAVSADDRAQLAIHRSPLIWVMPMADSVNASEAAASKPSRRTLASSRWASESDQEARPTVPETENVARNDGDQSNSAASLGDRAQPSRVLRQTAIYPTANKVEGEGKTTTKPDTAASKGIQTTTKLDSSLSDLKPHALPCRPRNPAFQVGALHTAGVATDGEVASQRVVDPKPSPGAQVKWDGPDVTSSQPGDSDTAAKRGPKGSGSRYGARTYEILHPISWKNGSNKLSRFNRHDSRSRPAQVSQKRSKASKEQPGDVPIDGMGNLSLSAVAARPLPAVRALRVPQPSTAYLEKASQPAKPLPKQQPLLVVFDLNGTLLYRPSRHALTSFIPRPGLNAFLDWLIDENGLYEHGHRAMIWSSAKPENVNKMVDNLFTPAQRRKVVAVWARDRLGLNQHQYNNKVQVYKELSKIWADQGVQQSYPDFKYPQTDADGRRSQPGRTGRWDQSNTVLVDDSILKASSEPHNLLQIAEFLNRPEQVNDSALKAAREYLQSAAKYHDVSCYIKVHPFGQPEPEPSTEI